MRSLNRLAEEAARSAHVEPIRDALKTAALELLGAGFVRLLDIAQDRAGASDRSADEFLRFTDGPSGTAHVIATRKPLAIDDAAVSTAIVPGRAALHGIASALFVPVIWADEVRSVLIVGWLEPHPVTADDIARAELATNTAAAGLARLEEESRRAEGLAQDRVVVRVANALNATLDLQEILLTLVHEAALALNADFTGVFLGDKAEGAVATAGYGVPEGWHGIRVEAGQGVTGRVLHTNATVVQHDYTSDLPLADTAKTLLAVPMSWNGEMRGVLTVGWASRRRVNDEDQHTTEAIAGLATLACRNAEAYEHVQHVARTDALTGVLNHGAMQVRIREEIARARRDGTPLGAVILDLDDFKSVNDTRGHAAGDELLRKVANALQLELRPYDQVARYGGDEFVLLLPGSDEEMTAHVAERCRDAIGGKCSIGVAAWHDGLDADGLLEQADRALMLAKRTGKGRVAVANPEVERELALLQSQAGSPAAVQALAAAIEERDNYKREHSDEVVRLSRGVAMMLGLPNDDVDRIAHGALLHDVGKLAMPAELLGKEGPLTPEEWAIMSQHPIAGERILARTKDLAGVAPIVRHEHEHWNGTGYPDGLEGHRIPIGSRVVHACHAYVAMRTARPYRDAISHEEVVVQLRAEAGTKFDPEVIEVLLDLLGHNTPDVPNRAAGVKLVAPTPREPSSRRSAHPGWVPGA
ncbi:diguanylate cyclase [Solirubrobacter soli]|uniref:diguanylate cyclase n=1 Tax=Solirubrobacter soli TaxID=363832 RepID=UPI0004110DA8|nr:diguanylate cyclase [Solirubrobacter soli]